MAVIVPVATVTYTYGAGNTPNRRIDFLRHPNGDLCARFSDLNNPRRVLDAIPANQIAIEISSLNDKIHAMRRRTQLLPNRLLSSFSPHNQDRIVRSISSDSKDHKVLGIEFDNGPVNRNGLETIQKVKIFRNE